MDGIFKLFSEKFNKLKNKKYRHAYLKEHIRVGIASQIRLIRNKSDINQSQLAEIIGTKQSVISRLEDPDSGSVNLKTLFKIAEAFDVGLLVKFVSFGKFINESQDISPKSLAVSNYAEEFERIKIQAASINNNITTRMSPILAKSSDLMQFNYITTQGRINDTIEVSTSGTFGAEVNIGGNPCRLNTNCITSQPVYNNYATLNK